MSLTHVITSTWTESGVSLTGSTISTSDNETNESVAYAASVTNLLKTVGIPTQGGRLKSIYILASTPLTIKTNSSGSPADTLALAAGVPFLWIAASGLTVPFTADITALYLTNATANTGNLDVRALFSA